MSFLSRAFATRALRPWTMMGRSSYNTKPMASSSYAFMNKNLTHRQDLSVPQAFSLQQQIRTFASKKHKRTIKMAKGFRGRSNRCFRAAISRVEKALQYAYRDRKVRKREFKKLWIERINAGVRQHGMSYSKFIAALHKSGITLDRKVLAELASNEPFSFKAVVDVVKLRSGMQ